MRLGVSSGCFLGSQLYRETRRFQASLLIAHDGVDVVSDIVTVFFPEKFHALRISAHHFVVIVVRHAHEEGVVGQRGVGRNPIFVFQKLLREGVGHRVGHLHERRRAARHGSAGLGGDGGFVRKARLPEMHLVVDQAGQQGPAERDKILSSPQKRQWGSLVLA